MYFTIQAVVIMGAGSGIGRAMAEACAGDGARVALASRSPGKLAEVNPSTLESCVARGLFLCGEILDMQGRLGGLDFQQAWSGGTVAGRAAAR